MGEKSSTGLHKNAASMLCYLLGWVTGLIFIILEKKSIVVLFHAWQSVIFFLTMSIITAVFNKLSIPSLDLIINIALGSITIFAWLYLMRKARGGEMWQMPIFGRYAAKIVRLDKLG